ncbi:MAG: hypothetical protein IJS54_07480 [Desulfovibrio sp.]|nr:hypothetical protein [Desulfovibrio sp.]
MPCIPPLSLLWRTILSLSLLCALFAISTPAFAHRVNIFAWVNGDTVHVKGSFSPKHPAKNATIAVTDAQTHAELLTGTTDINGLFSFAWRTLPVEHGLSITIDAGSGHRNSWLLDADAFGLASPSVNKEEAIQQEETPLRSIVREELSQALAPFYQELARQKTEADPTWKDILGGLGWIVGITALFVFARKSPKAP